MHSARRAGLSCVTANISGQPERVIDTPRQRLRCATTSSAARQCEAWLSPTSATVPRALPAGTPNSHGPRTPSNDSGVHGEFWEKMASSGGGTIAVRSLPFTQRRSGSRDAAPKQRSLAAGSVDTAMSSVTSLESGSRSSTVPAVLRTCQW